MKLKKDFFDHLIELRSVFFKAFLLLFIFLLILLPFSNEIYHFFAQPLIDKFSLYEGELISTNLTATFFVPLKITAYSALVMGLPLMLIPFWSFISPGLYPKEKKFILWAMVFAFILFLAAALFVYMLVFPLIFEFFIRMKPDDVRLMIDISSYLEMIISLFIAFGLAFQIPLLVIGLAKFNLISTSKLKAYRSYVLVFAFIFGAIFTPPDVISQLLLAIPVYLLYEVGIMFAKNSKKRI